MPGMISPEHARRRQSHEGTQRSPSPTPSRPMMSISSILNDSAVSTSKPGPSQPSRTTPSAASPSFVPVKAAIASGHAGQDRSGRNGASPAHQKQTKPSHSPERYSAMSTSSTSPVASDRIPGPSANIGSKVNGKGAGRAADKILLTGEMPKRELAVDLPPPSQRESASASTSRDTPMTTSISNGKATGPRLGAGKGAVKKSRREPSSTPLGTSASNAQIDWISDEPIDENSQIWVAELQAYKIRQQFRFQEIEKASHSRWAEDSLAVQKRLERGYEIRLGAVVRKDEQRELEEEELRAQEMRIRRELAKRRRERDLQLQASAVSAASSATVTGRGRGRGRGGRGSRGVGRGRGRGRGGALSGSAQPATPVALSEDGEADELDEGGLANISLTATPTKKGKGKKRRIEDLAAVGSPASDTAAAFAKAEADDAAAAAAAAALPVEPPAPTEPVIDPDGPPLPLDDKRLRQLEDAHRRIWVQIARKEIPKIYRVVQATVSSRSVYTKRVSAMCQREARRANTRNTKPAKDVQQKARKAMREMLVFWKRNEKEEKELRRKAEKEAADRLRKEEEMREAKRQARKLNFLITQTELYSHFVGNKLRTSEAEESEETSGSSKLIEPSGQASDAPASVPPVEAKAPHLTEADAAKADLRDIDFDDDDESNLRAHAARNAQEAVLAAREKAQAFDARAAEERKRLMQAAEEADGRRIDEKDLGKAFDSDDLNFQNPTSMGQMDITQPKMLTCQLKEYQLKGLNWLANLYEQGINGILADEMGLGKTVQSISLMSYLAEVHDIWGPFLVIAPSSTLHNWQQEISRFTPALKALPYWGNVKDRNVLRKIWNKRNMTYSRDSPFHVLVTSYQLVVSDEKYFKRIKWQYMILDEAQAIKSSSSTRWKTLLSFNCRNRLLLTGTPVQNSMQELWALLHFIMPSLFDSHDEFSEWFSKDIEGHAENKGTLNEGQLRRLHMILKPFMLRRIKKNVQNELGDKIEIDVLCDMSARQRMLYRGLRENVSLAELMDKASNATDEAGLKSLMNLVMQFRKVCNHPELFERADVTAPFTFGTFSHSASLTREGDLLNCPDSYANSIEYKVPKLISREGLLDRPGERSRAGFDTKYLDNVMNIWRQSYVATSLKESNSTFAALPLLNITPREAELAFRGHAAQRTLDGLDKENSLQALEPYLYDSDFAASSVRPFARVRSKAAELSRHNPATSLPRLAEVGTAYANASPLADPEERLWNGKAVAPPIQAYSNDRPFLEEQESRHRDELVSNLLYGVPAPGCESEELVGAVRRPLPGLPPRGVLSESSFDQMPAAQMQVPQINKLIIDSTKLAHLDRLLRELKANDHRVLIYFQMTKMIDLMEEYLIYRQYKYLRLDGSSKISDRRDMVTDWQTKPELFVFLLSTRAGGLGINLTAADTVIFFDSDWNPSNDQQAMDRAHRLGQTKQVTVYRLITRGTIDERIIKMARNKKEVQDMVVGTKTYSEAGMAKPQEIVSLLMDDDELADAMIRKRQAEDEALAQGKAEVMRENVKKRRAKKDVGGSGISTPTTSVAVNWALDDDEDDFFGAKPPAPPKIEEIEPSTAKGKGGAKKGGTASSDAAAAVGGTKRPKGQTSGNKRKKVDVGEDADAIGEDGQNSRDGTASPTKKKSTTTAAAATNGRRKSNAGVHAGGEVEGWATTTPSNGASPAKKKRPSTGKAAMAGAEAVKGGIGGDVNPEAGHRAADNNGASAAVIEDMSVDE